MWEKVSKKSFWTEFPSTVSNAVHFFVSQKNAVARKAKA